MEVTHMKNKNVYTAALTFLMIALVNPAFLFGAEETSMMMCDRGVVRIGDTYDDVRTKCGNPRTQGGDQWVYEPSPAQSFTVIFEEGKVVRILENLK
jgi:hypothetical protein